MGPVRELCLARSTWPRPLPQSLLPQLQQALEVLLGAQEVALARSGLAQLIEPLDQARGRRSGVHVVR